MNKKRISFRESRHINNEQVTAFAIEKPQGIPKKIVDRVCLALSVIMPLSALPQVFLIYNTQEVAGISLVSQVFYILGGIPFLLYGIFHKEIQISLLNAMWIGVNTSIVAGVLLYGDQNFLLAFR